LLLAIAEPMIAPAARPPITPAATAPLRCPASALVGIAVTTAATQAAAAHFPNRVFIGVPFCNR
jgi:hypothetical protein